MCQDITDKANGNLEKEQLLSELRNHIAIVRCVDHICRPCASFMCLPPAFCLTKFDCVHHLSSKHVLLYKSCRAYFSVTRLFVLNSFRSGLAELHVLPITEACIVTI